MSKILLIDDDEKLGELLTAFFGRFDLPLITATHPEVGLELLTEVGVSAEGLSRAWLTFVG